MKKPALYFITFLLLMLVILPAKGQVYQYIFESEEKGIEAHSFVTSDAFVNNFGELTNNTYSVKNEIFSEEDLVKRFYFANDKLIAQRNYTVSGELIDDEVGVSIYEYKYDDNQNLVKIKYFDNEKKAFQMSYAGPAAIEYKYDDRNNRTEVTYYNAYYELLDLGTAIIKYKYDKTSKLIQEQHFDAEENLLSDMAPIIKYAYNNEGEMIKQTFHNAQHELVTRFMDDDEEDIAYISFEYAQKELKAKHFFNKQGRLLGSEESAAF